MLRQSCWLIAFLLFPGIVAAQDAPAAPASDPMLQELEDIEAKSAELDRQRARLGIGGPITLTAVGFVGAAASGFFAFFVWFLDGAAHGFDGDQSDDGRRLMRTFGLIALGGVAIGAGGVTWLARRLGARGDVRHEQRALDERRRQLQLRLNAPTGFQSGGLSVRLAF